MVRSVAAQCNDFCEFVQELKMLDSFDSFYLLYCLNYMVTNVYFSNILGLRTAPVSSKPASSEPVYVVIYQKIAVSFFWQFFAYFW